MHSATVFFALAALASASAVGVVNDVYAYPSYKYSYGVADKLTGDQKSASEVRDGAVTKGSYSLVQPMVFSVPSTTLSLPMVDSKLKSSTREPLFIQQSGGGLGARSIVGGLGGGLQGGLIGGGLQGGLIGGRGLGLGLGGLGGLQGGIIG
ncbi:Cuticle protein 8 [Orchesella cincta]|uniref:Cuticle protein 8 n=1 Tax=Orchesella cincta TaxID=48709 RepID=A0A1D2NHM7_ORCCI|nr:Cuticle protein 8 [Orchesella cincta]